MPKGVLWCWYRDVPSAEKILMSHKSTSGVWRGGSGVDHEYVHQEAVLPLICLLLILIYTWGLLLYGASIVAYTENNTPADLKNEGR